MQSKCIVDGTLGLAPAAGPDTMESYVAPWSNSSLPFIRFWTSGPLCSFHYFTYLLWPSITTNASHKPSIMSYTLSSAGCVTAPPPVECHQVSRWA